MIKQLVVVALLSLFTSMVIAQSNNSIVEQTVKTELAENQAPITKMKFDEQVFEFGKVMEGEKIKNVFTFTNTGKEPLIISNAKGSCGCTVPIWPKEPIMPGESAELLVQFDSKGKGKVGGNMQSKRVSITANTDPMVSYLTIKGQVDKVDNAVTKIKKDKKSKINNPDIDATKVSLFPNPTNDQLTVDIKDYSNKKGVVEIYDGTGSKVATKNVADFKDQVTFNVSEFGSGIYTVSIKIDGMNRIAKRFLVPASE